MEEEKVLIVEDEQINVLLLKTLLHRNGYKTVVAGNGDDALARVSESRPDIILLDVMMPGKDGFEVCSILKQNDDTKSIPIILITALNARKDVDKGIELGVNDFISKPFNEKELLFRIQSLLKIKTLDSYIESQEVLFRDFEEATEKLFSETYPGSFNSYIVNIIHKILVPESSTARVPDALFICSRTNQNDNKGTFFRNIDEKLSAYPLELCIDQSVLEKTATLTDGVLVSNWKSVSDSLEEYNKMLPDQLVEAAGEIQNFIYIEKKPYRIILLNYHHSIQAFDITFLRHFIRLSESIIRILSQMKRSEEIYSSLSNSLSKIIEIRDNSDGKHIRVGLICRILCRELNCSDTFMYQMNEAIGLFDIGKLLVDQSVLLKNAPLTKSELAMVHKVPDFAETILDSEPHLFAAKEIAAGLYEKWDGSGYPHGKKGPEIPFSARIVSLANIYDSLRIQRNYRDGYPHAEAFKIITSGDDRVRPEHFDPAVLSAFIKAEKEIGNLYSETADKFVES